MGKDMLKVVPTKKKVWDTTKAGFRMGLAGGVPTLIANQILGPIVGRVVGSIAGGAMLKDSTESKVVVGQGVADAIIMLGM